MDRHDVRVRWLFGGSLDLHSGCFSFYVLWENYWNQLRLTLFYNQQSVEWQQVYCTILWLSTLKSPTGSWWELPLFLTIAICLNCPILANVQDRKQVARKSSRGWQVVVLQQKKPVVNYLPDTFSYTHACGETWVVRHERSSALLKTKWTAQTKLKRSGPLNIFIKHSTQCTKNLINKWKGKYLKCLNW